MRARLGLLIFVAVVALSACKSPVDCWKDVALGTPVADFRTQPASPGVVPEPVEGPVAEVLCCRDSRCSNPGACDCGVDCTQPLYREGGILGLSDSIETFEGYPQLGNEYAICEVWDFEGRVTAVWWAPQY